MRYTTDKGNYARKRGVRMDDNDVMASIRLDRANFHRSRCSDTRS